MGDIIQIIQALVLGAVQGLSEFLPISSSGHLITVRWLFGWNSDPFLDSVQFDVALHIGTLLAVLAFFWRDFQRLIVAWVGSLRHLIPARGNTGIVAGARVPAQLSTDARVAWLILVGIIPAVVAGLLLEKRIDQVFHEPANLRWSILLIAAAQVIFATLLLLVDRHNKAGRTTEQLTWLDGISIGLAQALALLPGVSRSGVTMTAGLWRGLDRATATRFSFLLSSPLVAAAGFKTVYDLRNSVIPTNEYIALIIGMVTSAVVGYLSIGWLLSMVQHVGLRGFVLYRYAVAVLIVLKVLFGGV